MTQPWASRFSPRTLKEVAGNEGAIKQLRTWVRGDVRYPSGPQRAAFLYGPPGVGKTSSVIALANDLGYELIKVNASDYRTRKHLKKLVGRAALQTVTPTGKRRMILFDELEGVSSADRGGISAIAAIIKETRVPIVLVAMSVGERWEEKFRPLVGLSLLIEYHPVPFGEVVKRLRICTGELSITVDTEALEFLAGNSEGDLRSALNDLETIARGKEKVTLSDCEALSLRDRKDYTPDALTKMFSAKTLRDARRIISSAHIGYDDLFDWIYENLPAVLTDPGDLVEGMDALARADIHQTRGKRTQKYRLLKYMFNDMTGGVALSWRGGDLPAFGPPQSIWRYRRTWAKRRRRRSIAGRVAEKFHISMRKAVAMVMPLIKVIYQHDPSMAKEISGWLELEDKEAEWLRSGA